MLVAHFVIVGLTLTRTPMSACIQSFANSRWNNCLYTQTHLFKHTIERKSHIHLTQLVLYIDECVRDEMCDRACVYTRTHTNTEIALIDLHKIQLKINCFGHFIVGFFSLTDNLIVECVCVFRLPFFVKSFIAAILHKCSPFFCTF